MALTKKEQENIIVSKAMKAASARRVATKVIVIVLTASLVISGGAWGVISFIDANSMMISINEAKVGLALSNDATFEYPTTNINMKGPKTMDAYTYSWFDENNILGKDGAHHGYNYICYSFYLKNVSPTNACSYTLGIKFTKDTKNVSAATRILLIQSDENCENEVYKARCFAKAREDGTAEYISYDECEPNQQGLLLENLDKDNKILNTNMTYPFMEQLYNNETGEDLGYYAFKESERRLSHNAYIKFTVVMWLEGTDLQCVNSILGGKCVVQFEFTLDEMLEIEYYGD